MFRVPCYEVYSKIIVFCCIQLFVSDSGDFLIPKLSNSLNKF